MKRKKKILFESNQKGRVVFLADSFDDNKHDKHAIF